MQSNRPDDLTLSAWIDGELPAKEMQAIEAWLHDHPDGAIRPRRWVADRDALRACYQSVLEDPVPAAMLDTVNRRRSVLPVWKQAAMAASLLIVGGLVGGALTGRYLSHAMVESAVVNQDGIAQPVSTNRANDWPRRAAVAHAVYVPEVRHPVDVNVAEGAAEVQKAQEEHLSRWLTKRLGMPVKLFDLGAQGFSLVGGRLLPDAHGPSAQLMYQAANGQRVTVYLRKPDDATSAAFRYEREGPLGLFYWVESGAGYALVGDLPRHQLLALSEAIYAQGQMTTPAAPR